MKKHKAWIITGVAVVLLIILGGAAWEYHEQPQFCAICHIMEPYLESWESSPLLAYSHAEDEVTCLECHEPTIRQQVEEGIKFVTNDYEVPLEERAFDDAWCFRCHEHGTEEEIIELTAAMPINPHESHFDDIACSTCHKMHRDSEDFCALCHKPLVKDEGWIIPTEEYPQIPEWWNPDIDCDFCHDMTAMTDSLQNPDLLVYTHAEEELDCPDCHEETVEKQIHEDARPDTPEIYKYTTPKEFCFDCHIDNEHESYAEIIDLTKDYIIAGENINPHDPHPNLESEDSEIQEMECYHCHSMHDKSPGINYCYSCHHKYTFESCYTSDCHGDSLEMAP